MYTYGYFIGCLILGIVWLLILIVRKDLRKEILFGSLLGLPFGFSELLIVPEYWNPPSIFNLIHKLGFGIESFIFAFFVAGIAAVAYEFITKSKLKRIKSDHKTHIFPYIAVMLWFVALEIFIPSKTVFNLCFALLAGAGIIAIKRPDLIKQIVISGFIFGVLYTLLFFFFMKLFPGFIQQTYSLQNFLGVFILGVPIEETLFAFSVGACWSTFFEYIRGYKLFINK